MMPHENEPGYEQVFSTYITLRNKKRLYAWEVGKKAFVFWVKKKS